MSDPSQSGGGPSALCQDLLRFIDASPTPYHCVAEAARRLDGAGFIALDESEAWSLKPGTAAYTTRGGGSLIAFRVGQRPLGDGGFVVFGAHTDSPNLRIKPVPDISGQGYLRLGVEMYGGVLLGTWTDRDLSLAGRVALRAGDGGASEIRLLRIDRPLLRIPQLAIHLNREVNQKGLILNAQRHLPPLLALRGEGDEKGLHALLAEALDVAPERISAWDLCLYDVQPSTVSGWHHEFIHAPRLDNQAMCHAGLTALLDAPDAAQSSRLLVLFDHEEVGSGSQSGAKSTFLGDVLDRIVDAHPAEGEGLRIRARQRSLLISGDMAHAIHPNYDDMHDPLHLPRINAGPVIKVNAQARYASDADTTHRFAEYCERAEVPYQKFVNRTDLACGSTIGPLSAATVGIPTVDVGNPMLSMHSIREMAGAKDPELMVRVLGRAFADD